MSKTMKCPKCGAEVDYSPSGGILKCPYCGKQTAIKEEFDPKSISADFIIPTKLDKDRLHAETQAYMVSGDYTPDDIVDRSEIVKEEIQYHPAYVSTGSFTANWTASFGYDREEEYQVWGTTITGQSGLITKTKTVTDWRPVNGVATGDFLVFAYAGNQLEDEYVIQLVETPFGADLSGMDPSYTAGHSVEPYAYDVKSSAVNGKISAKIDAIIDKEVKSHEQGDHSKNWQWNAKLQGQKTSTVLIALGHSIFTYVDKDYDVYVSATGANRVVGTELPRDKTRGYKVWLGFLPTLLAVLAFALFGYFLGNIGYDFSFKACLALIVCLIAGFIRRKIIINYSQRLRNSKLAHQQINDINIDAESEEHRELLAKAQMPKAPQLLKYTWDVTALVSCTLITVSVIFFSGIN